MSDLSVEILKQIRDELKESNGRLERVETQLELLERRKTEAEIRLATELVAVVGAVRELRDPLLEDRKLRETVANHETRLAALERRTG
jgi:hypothetical protein